jgi:hypothetical protein
LTVDIRAATISTLATSARLTKCPRRLAWPRTSPFHGGNTGSNPVGDAKSFQKFKSAGGFFAGTVRMKSFVVAPVRFPGQQTFAHQRSVIFWSQHRFRVGTFMSK